MSTLGPSVHLGKRRRTGRKLAPMTEDDDSAVDTVMYQSLDIDNTRQKMLVPVRLDQIHKVGPVVPDPDPEPEPEPELEYTPAANLEMGQDPPSFISTDKNKRQWFYMQEFVSRVDGILDSMQTRETLPELGMCAECTNSVG